MQAASFDDLTAGDRVRHPTCGDGTVTATTEGVAVEFDKIGRNGRHWTGLYDRRWFEIVGTLVKLPKSDRE